MDLHCIHKCKAEECLFDLCMLECIYKFEAEAFFCYIYIFFFSYDYYVQEQ